MPVPLGHFVDIYRFCYVIILLLLPISDNVYYIIVRLVGPFAIRTHTTPPTGAFTLRGRLRTRAHTRTRTTCHYGTITHIYVYALRFVGLFHIDLVYHTRTLLYYPVPDMHSHVRTYTLPRYSFRWWSIPLPLRIHRRFGGSFTFAVRRAFIPIDVPVCVLRGWTLILPAVICICHRARAFPLNTPHAHTVVYTRYYVTWILFVCLPVAFTRCPALLPVILR